jgi:hypothetical protein
MVVPGDPRMVKQIGNVRAGDRRWIYVRHHPLIWIPLLAVVGGCVALVPGVLPDTAVGQMLPAVWAYAWVAMYLGGGLCALVSANRLNAHWEAAGFCLIASCSAVYSLAIFSARSLSVGAFAATVFAGLCFTCWSWAWLLATKRGMNLWRSHS